MADRLTADQIDSLESWAQMSTAGPWIAWSQEGEAPNGRFKHSVCVEDPKEPGVGHVCVAEAFGDTMEEAEANALLISKVPALLSEITAVRAEHEALKDAVKAIGEAANDRPGEHSAWDKLPRVLKAVNAAMDVACGVKR